MGIYKPSNKAPVTGIFTLLIIGIAGGVILGLLTFVVSQFIYLIFLFPVGLGLIGGILMHVSVHRCKIRNPIIGAACGIVMGLTIYGTFRYAEYSAFVSEGREILSQEMPEGLGSDDSDVVDSIIEEMLFEATGSIGFWGYLKFSAGEGTSFERLFSGQSFEINPTMTWIYWIAELAIIVGVAAYLAYDAASDPFCETCQNWYKPKYYLGGVKADQEKILFQAIQAGNFPEVGRLIQAEASAPSVDVLVQDCHCVANDSILFVDQVSVNKREKLESRTIFQGMITPEQREILAEYEEQDEPEHTEMTNKGLQEISLPTSSSDILEPTPEKVQSNSPVEKDYTRTRMFLVIAILVIVLPFCIAILFSMF